MDTDERVKKLAEQAGSWFTSGERKSEDTGRQIRIVKDGAPEWVSDLCHEAHGDMFPDDWRYEFIEDSLERIAEADNPDDALDEIEPDIYNADRLRWLSSHLDRAGYCDQAQDEGLVADDVDLMDRIGLGQYMEKREVLDSVLGFLRNLAEEQEDVEADTI
jgi:hypothetical protein